jgi:hypothetical protein
MKYKIIATVFVLLIIVAALALKGCSHTQELDENGNPIQAQEVQQ